MENWLSIVVAVFLIAMALYGHHKGFIRLAVSAAALAAALLIVNAAMPQVTDYLKGNTKIYNSIENGMRKAAGLEEEGEAASLPPAAQRSMIENLKLPEQLKKELLENNNNEVYHVLGVETFTDYVTSYLANSVISIIAFLVMFAVVFTALKIIVSCLDLVARLPIISGINKLAGAALGAAEGLIVLWLLSLLVTVFTGTPLGQEIIAQIESSSWLSFIYEHNLLGGAAMLAMKGFL